VDYSQLKNEQQAVFLQVMAYFKNQIQYALMLMEQLAQENHF